MRMNDTRGSMPFAVIAVTILIVSVAAAAVTAGYQRGESGTDGVIDGIDAVDEAVVDITEYVNRTLGEKVRQVSVTDSSLLGYDDSMLPETEDTWDPDDGTPEPTDKREPSELEKRAAVFVHRADEWILDNFPMVSGGATARYVEHTVELVAEPMSLSSEMDMEGCVQTYLRGTGSITVDLESQSGRMRTEIPISTDGGYALPLAAERGSLLESMAGDGGISISQMMEYQLTSLAQYRVLNGYGSLSTAGDRGTASILTAEDVIRAYRISVQAIEAIAFRDGDNPLAQEDGADLADMLAGETVTIDLAAVYAQALVSAIDDVVLRWLDYFYINTAVNLLEEVMNPFRNALRTLWGYITGEEMVSGVPYLKKVMEANGYSESDYRYPGSGTTTVTSHGVTVTVANPTADLFSMSWLTDFRQRYDQGDDFVGDFLMDVLKRAAIGIQNSRDLGTVTVSVDAFDDRDFLTQVTDAFVEASKNGTGIVNDAIRNSLADAEVYDEFYAALADEIAGHASDLVLSNELESRLRSAFQAKVSEMMAAVPKGETYRGPTVEQLMSSVETSRALNTYRSLVHSDLSVFEPLKRVEDGDGSIIKAGLTVMCSLGLDVFGGLLPVEENAMRMVEEIRAQSGTNPYGGIVELPDTDVFVLEDDGGNEMRERLESNLTVTDPQVTLSCLDARGVHTVGFRENPATAYSTTFEIGLRGVLEYDVKGWGSLAGSMGPNSSSYGGFFGIDTTINVTVVSGWALSGIAYEPSCTVLTDLWELLLDVLGPIIEPLRAVLEAIRGALTALGETLMDVAGFVTEHLVKLYEFLMDPIATLKELLETAIQTLIENVAFDILMDINLGDQSIAVQFFGCTLTFTTSAITWKANTKTLLTAELTMPIAGLEVNAGLTAKIRGDVKAENLIITGFGGIKGDDWSVKGKFDPLMKGSKYLVTLDGKVGRNGVSIAAPKLDQYHELGMSLEDLVGPIVIPLPMFATSVSFDAGFGLKYSNTRDTGLVINEIETNPEGTDRGNEWFEVLNNTGSTIDLEGYSITYGTKSRVAETLELDGEVSPGEFLVIEPGFTLVNKSGKWLRILDPEGEVVDEVQVKADSDNDSNTWQREFDGATEWVFADATMGRSNGGSVSGMIISPAEVKAAVWEGVQKAFGKVEHITDLDSAVAYVQNLVRYTVEAAIDIVSAKVIEASVYVDVGIGDVTSTFTTGIEVGFRTDGDLVRDVLRFVAGHLEAAVMGIKNPYGIDPLGMFTENIDLQVAFHAGVGMPKLLQRGLDLVKAGDLVDDVELSVLFRANLASLTRLAGIDTGDRGMDFGIVFRDVPEALIPKRVPHSKGMDYDLWLFRVEVTAA